MADEPICVGVVTGAHGVRGLVRLKSFTAEPGGVAAYGPVHDKAGRLYRLKVVGAAGKGQLSVRIEGVADRTAAEALKGTRFYVGRDALPPPGEDEFYHADLVGLAVETVEGEPLGRVRAVHDFGAGDVVEVAGAGAGAKVVVVPFTRAAVPLIDIDGGRMVVDPPPGLLEPGEPEPAGDDGGEGGQDDEEDEAQ